MVFFIFFIFLLMMVDKQQLLESFWFEYYNGGA